MFEDENDPDCPHKRYNLKRCIEQRQEPVFGYPLMNFEADDNVHDPHPELEINKPIEPAKFKRKPKEVLLN